MFFQITQIPQRSDNLEWIDLPNTSDDELGRAFDFIQSTQKKIGANRALLGFFNRCSRRWQKSRAIRILVWGCGRGDTAALLSDWGEGKKVDLSILAVDRWGRIVHMAKDRYGHKSSITFDVRDTGDPLFLQAQQFDYVVSVLNLHHVEDSLIKSHLKTINLLAKRGVFVSDWIRDKKALFLQKTLARGWKDEIVIHDAPLSVKRGFLIPELSNLCPKAGLEFAELKTHLGVQFIIQGERRLVMEPKLKPVTGLVGT